MCAVVYHSSLDACYLQFVTAAHFSGWSCRVCGAEMNEVGRENGIMVHDRKFVSWGQGRVYDKAKWATVVLEWCFRYFKQHPLAVGEECFSIAFFPALARSLTT